MPQFMLPSMSMSLKVISELLHKTGFSGLSVTIPYKEMVCRLAERIDKTAEQISAAKHPAQDKPRMGRVQYRLDRRFEGAFGCR